MSVGVIELLKHIYEDNHIFIKDGQYTSDEVPNSTGLRQGCPLSLTLFSLYIADLEQQLLTSEIGFKFAMKGNFWDLKEKKFSTVPGQWRLPEGICRRLGPDGKQI